MSINNPALTDQGALGPLNFGYASGTAGTLAVPSGYQVVGILVYVTDAGGGTVVINGGNSIAVPPNVGLNIPVDSYLVGPFNIVFTNTYLYYVQYGIRA